MAFFDVPDGGGICDYCRNLDFISYPSVMQFWCFMSKCFIYPFRLQQFFILALLFINFYAVAQMYDGQHIVNLKTGRLSMLPNAAKWLDSMNAIAPKEPVLSFVHFNTLPNDAQKAELQRQGITLLEYIPNLTYSALVNFPIDARVLAVTPIHSMVTVNPNWKADNYTWNKIDAQKGTIEILATFYTNIDAATIRHFIGSMGGQIDPSPMERYGSYKVIIEASKVRSMAGWYGLQNLSPVTTMVPLDLQSKPAVKGNVATSLQIYGGYALTGDGVCVGVGDDASGIYHADIKDRITNFNPAPIAHHGEHVNGIVGGAANIDPLAIGMAPHVTLVDHLYDLILPATGAMLHDYNMTVTNNSYGVILGDCSYSGTYDAYAHFLDTLAVQYPQVLHVFASGNDGYLTCGPYLQGFGTVGGGYQPAKNCLVVGSMTDFLGEAGDESRGPVKDGRLKPEIIAVGLGAYSTIGVDDYEWAAGTSMASPQVAGAAALLTQRYKQLNGGVGPQSDLLKTFLMNGALDVGNPGPDFSYGFGSLDVARSLKIIDNNNYYIGSINYGETKANTIAIPANTAQVKIMLYWNDVPASASSAFQLVNDLDLSVVDLAGGSHLPLILDTIPANVNNVATEHADHLNNVEQVVINNPAAGSYTIKVNGYNIPYGPQRFVVAYDVIPAGIQLTYPIGGEQLENIDSIRIFWDAISNGNPFKVEFSGDGGITWVTLADSVAPNAHYLPFIAAGYNSGSCKIRVSRYGTGESVVSGNFAVCNIPVASLDSSQCPGYIKIHWNKIPNATNYQLLSKQGFYMQIVGSTTDTNYTFVGMPLNAPSYVAVQPVLNGNAGYRSVALKVTANSGNCSGSISAGDLMVEAPLGPQSGRVHTVTQLGTNDTIKLKVRDLYATSCNSYSIVYSVNGGVWQYFSAGPVIPADNSVVVAIPGNDFSAVGTYNITAVIHNQIIADPQSGNDTIRFTVTQLPNDSLVLPFFDGFDSVPVFGVSHDSVGVTPNGHWDFSTNDSAGRVRSFVFDNVVISGARSISLDENQRVTNGSNNVFTGTFNLSGFDTGVNELRLDFDYVLAGTPKTSVGNTVWTRANDTLSWSALFNYNLNAYPGYLNHARSLSLTDAARAGGHNFSSSYQVSFGQNDTSLIAAANYGNGLTLDNVKIYSVANDAQLVQVVAPLPTNCGLAGPQPLTVQVHNGVNYTLYNVQMFYSMDSGTVYTGVIDSITAKATINYTFSQQLTISTGATHFLNVWLAEAGDTYTANDSILNYKFRNNLIVTTYPYLENFESGNGGYYTEGLNDSWQYGTPASSKINKAASGTKAWKTNLTGNYNNLETSYLYSPCFDISTLTNPMLSFSAALDVENCGATLCDRAYIEYTFNGQTWTKLGAAGQGTNWYDSTFDAWNTEGFTRWHVASIPIPLPIGENVISFRFVLNSDPGATFEGFGVDDVHIFDRAYGIFPVTGVTTVTQNLSSNNWVNYIDSSNLLASINAENQSIAGAEVTLFEHDTLYNPGNTQYTFPRSFTVKSASSPGDSVGLGLYLLESDVVKVANDYTCPSCNKIVDAYSLGITQYDDVTNSVTENGTLNDDTAGVYTYYNYKLIQWIPYDQGYYAQLTVKPFSEFWFNDGGPTGNLPAGVDYLSFNASRTGNNVSTKWVSLIDTAVSTYYLERSTNDTSFPTIFTTPALHLDTGTYTKIDSNIFPNAPVMYYRLKWTMKGRDNLYYSPVRRVDNTDSAGINYLFNALAVTRNTVLVTWTAFADGITKSYKLERAIGSGPFEVIDTQLSRRHYGQHYTYVDEPVGLSIGGTALHYRLTAIMQTGDATILPVRTVLWPGIGAVPAVYPNPSTDGSLNITWYGDAGNVMQLNLTDIAGKRLYETSVIATQWINNTRLSLPFKPQGVYMLKMKVGGQEYVSKVVFE